VLLPGSWNLIVAELEEMPTEAIPESESKQFRIEKEVQIWLHVEMMCTQLKCTLQKAYFVSDGL
jgi:hypothetical protein